MADKKISELDPILGADSATGDLFVLVDVSTGETKHMSRAEVIIALSNEGFPDGTALFPSIANNGDLNTGMWFPAADTIAWSKGGVEAMRLDASGALLHGTTVAGSAGAGDIVVNGGVFLGGSAAANELNDYEKGTWTPAVSFSGGSTGVTYTDRDGRYIKIGNVVIVYGTIELSNNGTDAGTMAIIGLPFVVSNEFTGTTIQGGGVVGFWSGLATAVMSLTLTAIQSSSSARVRRTITAVTATGSLTDVEIGNTGALRFQFSYIAA